MLRFECEQLTGAWFMVSSRAVPDLGLDPGCCWDLWILESPIPTPSYCALVRAEHESTLEPPSGPGDQRLRAVCWESVRALALAETDHRPSAGGTSAQEEVQEEEWLCREPED
ncbi:hypothetical protein NDU88_002101 [Pleurodeles waltl]|uniref:Uncharacterized protein n=1 Tax=Pleurodeles waltl TaxID=8319 RepID=A0AAV7PAP0_PLEWA|nr:hypothetical protein NDU88_002101 [Pleurodeles waltl]